MVWRKCSVCKTEIPVKSKYYECSVSTCNGKRTGLVFCSIPCFERHLPGARHKDAAAIECLAPATPAMPSSSSQPAAKPGVRRIVQKASSPASASSAELTGQGDRNEILIVASKLKKFIQDEAGMNTSQSVMNALSDIVRKASLEAIKNAQAEGRKTVMDRDFK